jgi:hypothetical protein
MSPDRPEVAAQRLSKDVRPYGLTLYFVIAGFIPAIHSADTP